MLTDAMEKIESIKKACLKVFGYIGVFSFFINMFMLTVPLYMLQVYDRVLTSHSYDTLIYLTIIAVVALLIMGSLDVVRSHVMNRLSHWLDNQLSPFALTKSPDELLQGGGYSSQSLRDIAAIRKFLGGPPVFTFFDAPWIPVYFGVIFMIQPYLCLIAIAGAIILFGFALLNDRLTSELALLASQQSSIAQGHIEKTLVNAEAIQAMGMLPNVIKKWFAENEKALQMQTIVSDRTNFIVASSKIVRLLIQVAMLGVGAMLVVQNQITPGVMIACSIISARALAPIEQTIGVWKQWGEVKCSYDRLTAYLLRPDPRGEGIELPKPKGKLTVNNLTYVPPQSKKPIIYEVSFQLEPGEVLVLMGPSGSGKSTLARLLLGIWRPTGGAARLDGANVYEWKRNQFGGAVGYMPQNVDLFNGSIRENISRMTEADDEKIISAAQQAGAHELILQFPGGYEFNIGMFNLSGGQRQRVALARAFFGDPCLIVLDEPDASLDPEGVAALVGAIKTAKSAGKAVVIISHRSDFIRHADKIMLLNNGTVNKYGPRDQVLAELKKIGQAQQQAEKDDQQ